MNETQFMGLRKRLSMKNCTKKSLRMAPNSKVVSYFQDDPTINMSIIIVLLRHVWMYTSLREDFEKERRENEFEKKEKRKNLFLKYHYSLFIS